MTLDRLLPEINLGSSPASFINPKQSLPGSAWFAGNFNPAINALSAQQLARELPAATAHLRSASTASSPNKNITSQDFFGSNPYWLRADQVEEYRASLYGRLAHNAAGAQAAHKIQQQQQQSQTGVPNTSLPLPAGFRPAFFTSSNRSASEAGEDNSPPPYSPRQAPASHFIDAKSPRDVSAAALFAAQQQPSSYSPQVAAAVGSFASQTLFSRMAQAFVEAFAGPAPGSQTVGGAKAVASWDANKVAAILSGQARLEVVPQQAQQTPTSVEGLGLQLGGLSLDNAPGSRDSRSRSPSPGPTTPTTLPCSFDEIRRRWTGQ